MGLKSDSSATGLFSPGGCSTTINASSLQSHP